MSLYFPGVALITGSASGIGQGIAVAFAKDGCRKIALCDRNEKGLQETRRLIADVASECETLCVYVDLQEEGQVEEMVRKTLAVFGRVDYAVNTAGEPFISYRKRSSIVWPATEEGDRVGIEGDNKTSTESDSGHFDRVNTINYRGCWLSSKNEIAQMLKQDPLQTHDGRLGNRGSIVNIASQLAFVSRPEAAAYCASKAAVVSMTKSDAIDYSKDNIRINCVCPGITATPMLQRQMDLYRDVISRSTLNRLGTVQEIADVVLFLCSSRATFVQGAAYVVDGGYTIH